MNQSLRIASLLPSATEIICALGLEEQLVGISHECDFPVSVRSLPAVTASAISNDLSSGDIDAQVREHLQSNAALYTIDGDIVSKLAPDLIVTQALCDVCAVSAADVAAVACELTQVAEVINLEPACLQDVFDTIHAVGVATGAEPSAASLVAGLKDRLQAVQRRSAVIDAASKPSVVMLEWLDPPFNAGHWTPELVEYAGGEALLSSPGQPSTTIAWDQVRDTNPALLVIACCGFNIERTRRDIEVLQDTTWWKSLQSVATRSVYVIDGNQYFNRPGPRLIDSLEILAHILHPALHPLPPALNNTFVRI
ncbi:MAG: ABC transporter substrate-binding protein [Pseudomonadota bacterium]